MDAKCSLARVQSLISEEIRAFQDVFDLITNVPTMDVTNEDGTATGQKSCILCPAIESVLVQQTLMTINASRDAGRILTELLDTANILSRVTTTLDGLYRLQYGRPRHVPQTNADGTQRPDVLINALRGPLTGSGYLVMDSPQRIRTFQEGEVSMRAGALERYSDRALEP